MNLIRAAISDSAMNMINTRRTSRIVERMRNALTNYATHPKMINHHAWLVTHNMIRIYMYISLGVNLQLYGTTHFYEKI